jgi:hypothetical protein
MTPQFEDLALAHLATAPGSSVKATGTSKRAADVFSRSLPTRIRVGKSS